MLAYARKAASRAFFPSHGASPACALGQGVNSAVTGGQKIPHACPRYLTVISCLAKQVPTAAVLGGIGAGCDLKTTSVSDEGRYLQQNLHQANVHFLVTPALQEYSLPSSAFLGCTPWISHILRTRGKDPPGVPSSITFPGMLCACNAALMANATPTPDTAIKL